MTTTTTLAWQYHAVNAAGRRERGVAEAESPVALTRTLEARGLVVLDVEPAVAARPEASRGPRFGARRDVLELTRALGALLSGGIPLARALSTVASITPGATATVVEDVRQQIARGESLTVALERHPRLFPKLYTGVVRAGERSGNLAGAFTALATQLERDERLRDRLLSASIYPLVLIGAGLGAVSVLVLFVLPRFAALLADARATLPRSTTLLLHGAEAVRHAWPVLLAVLVAIVAGVTIASRTEGGRRLGSTLMLHLPVVSALRRYTLAARFARMLGVLLEGGAPVLAALDDARLSLSDPLARDEIARVRARVRDGVSLNAAIGEGALWVPLLPRLVAVGEEAGRLEEFLARAADICEDKAARLIERLVALAEPAMIVILGAVIAFVALSLLQAIYGVDASAFR